MTARPASPAASPTGSTDAAITRELEAWFPAAARALPWRTSPRDPYNALVAEAMLQQTQVSRVIDRYTAFIARFPRVNDLAGASEGDVLAMWSGLGYYRRARLLHAAAKAIVTDHHGVVPHDPEVLRSLQGVGRYTAGAITSIAFDRPAPIVDGNVRRVLMRLHGRAFAPDDRDAERWAWTRASELVHASASPAVFNEALMELGATVCVPPPAAPRCDQCPWAGRCNARREGTTNQIPAPKAAAKQRVVCCISLLARDARGRFLVEQRPSSGMWAGMWQLPTLERETRWPDDAAIRDFAAIRGLNLPTPAEPLGTFTHQTTHRIVRFRVLAASPIACNRKSASRTWVDSFDGLGVSSAQQRALALGITPGRGQTTTPSSRPAPARRSPRR